MGVGGQALLGPPGYHQKLQKTPNTIAIEKENVFTKCFLLFCAGCIEAVAICHLLTSQLRNKVFLETKRSLLI